jgi:radical SAM superfamily enzyme YgiQ (UPF0313 family)
MQMNIVLISTYELGRQPFGLASPAAWLRKRGHRVECADLTRQQLDARAVEEAQLIAIYLPMHTATRLAAQLIPSLRERNPRAHLCCYGLYAPMNADYLRSLGVQTILGGEFEPGLVALAARLSGKPQRPPDNSAEKLISLERLPFEVPDRSGMPPIEKYAHLVLPGGGFKVVGSTEASRGCKHLCRHCPIVPVYNGVFRIVSRDVVMADIRQQVAAGAQHISFGDPDFFNGIGHATALIEAFHHEFPGLTYDVTIKIEHLRKYQHYLTLLRDTGCLFVISAVESVDDVILERLDKGHTRQDFLAVVRNFRSLGMTLHPTFVPFSPWTTLEGYLDLLTVLRDEQLIENVTPVQLGIRLLIPAGSRLLELEEIPQIVQPFDPQSLAFPWSHNDERVDRLSKKIQEIAADADQRKQNRFQAFERIWHAAHAEAGRETPDPVVEPTAASAVPFLSEPWYCCAEPTQDQLVSIGNTRRETPVPVASLAGVEGWV